MSNREERRHPAQIPPGGTLIRKRSDYVCPSCGERPYLADNGQPESIGVSRDQGKGKNSLHCASCFAVWQQAVSALMPFQVPELVYQPLDLESSNLGPIAKPQLVRAN